MKIQEITAKIQKWRQYRASVRELARLTDRELADLGICRSEISQVAKTGHR